MRVRSNARKTRVAPRERSRARAVRHRTSAIRFEPWRHDAPAVLDVAPI